MAQGELFILSAPSGAGKTTLIQRMFEIGLFRSEDLAFSVSHTTRAPRRGEADGTDYHFVSQEEFQEMIAQDRFLEWAEVHNNYYGTSLAEVLPRLERGVDVVMDIDVQGAERVLAHREDAHSIFILPPSFEALADRLRHRGLDDPAEISRRLAVSRWEIKRYRQYHYVIVNDDAARASQALAAIILDKRHRLKRMEKQVTAVVDDFARAE